MRLNVLTPPPPPAHPHCTECINQSSPSHMLSRARDVNVNMVYHPPIADLKDYHTKLHLHIKSHPKSQ